ncbi:MULTISPECIES: hypothetical protein [unclassified Paenibacillus]|uniref:hypothetical protein n=1 Tax=unclassified Paenibacillus TaxID=185978 RepID=UPI0021190417|nr:MULTISPECIES: hypothetical protein [unclassified Paenibacillus]
MKKSDGWRAFSHENRMSREQGYYQNISEWKELLEAYIISSQVSGKVIKETCLEDGHENDFGGG